jgi:hypothetical protein
MNEYRFTFTRYSDGGMEEQGRIINAENLEEATVEAQSFCRRNQCKISRVEWYDEEAERWQNSVVQYA